MRGGNRFSPRHDGVVGGLLLMISLEQPDYYLAICILCCCSSTLVLWIGVVALWWQTSKWFLLFLLRNFDNFLFSGETTEKNNYDENPPNVWKNQNRRASYNGVCVFQRSHFNNINNSPPQIGCRAYVERILIIISTLFLASTTGTDPNVRSSHGTIIFEQFKLWGRI